MPFPSGFLQITMYRLVNINLALDTALHF
uniref:Uncharacterized protein n=1 Tax=Rhizophora mucronata TaxID=61149 RepID=A0A2P2QG49_RHIMU